MRLFICITLFMLGSFITAQVITHKVEPKETVYGISKQYNITQEALKEANPFLYERDPQPGDILSIPATGKTVTEQIIQEDDEYNYITIEPKETLFNLTQTYQISEEKLISLNPQLKEGLKMGDVIRIPKKKIVPKGKHLVKEGETLYSISKKYNVSMEQLYSVNRDLQVDALPVDSYINIPQKNENVSTTIENDFLIHHVEPGDTLFSLLKQYNISLEELTQANPQIEQGLKAGDTLKIPLATRTTENNDKTNIIKSEDDVISVTLFLPYYLGDKSKKGFTKVSTEFLTGAFIALDSLYHQGKKIKLNVVDAGNESKFSKFLENYDYSATDLIIGPFQKTNFKSLSDKLKGSNIPMVFPFDLNEEVNDKHVIFPVAHVESMLEKIAEEITLKHTGIETVYLYTESEEKQLAQTLKEILKNKGITNAVVTENVDDISIKQNLMTGQNIPAIAVLVSEKETIGTAFVKKVLSLAETDANSIIPFGVFQVNAFDKYAKKLRTTGLIYTCKFRVNIYGSGEKATLKKYNRQYKKNPEKFAVFGFDVLYDLLSRMDENQTLFNNLEESQTQLGSKFQYKQTLLGGYINEGYRLITIPKN